MSEADELERLKGEINKLGLLMRRIDAELQPGQARERDLKSRITQTHGGPGKFNQRRAPERAPMYDELTDLAVKNGPLRNERRRMVQLTNAFMRDAANFERVFKGVKK